VKKGIEICLKSWYYCWELGRSRDGREGFFGWMCWLWRWKIRKTSEGMKARADKVLEG